ncbi:dihydrofolate reductase family protein [Kribbella turkmenica]|nr:dihydrofolate reductase family protein [Kribbella turkmenica]
MNRTPKVVLSSDTDFDVSSWPNSTLAAGDGVDHVRRLKDTAGGSLVVFGGAKTVRSLVAADLVDEYWIKLNPAIVGHGGSMFTDVTAPRSLTLRSARSYPSGTVALIYSARTQPRAD